jgi:hypothetical protein
LNVDDDDFSIYIKRKKLKTKKNKEEIKLIHDTRIKLEEEGLFPPLLPSSRPLRLLAALYKNLKSHISLPIPNGTAPPGSNSPA